METRSGEMMVSPYLGIMNRSGLRMMKAASELGFSPASRPRLSTGKEGDQPEDIGWSRLQVIQGGRE
jgi:phage terminase small subunit